MRFARRTAAVLLLALVAGAAVASANGGGYGGGHKGGYGGGHKGGKGGGHKGGKGGYNPPSHPYPNKPSVSVKDSNILSNIQANQASVVAVKDLDVTAKGDRNDYGNNAILTVDTRPDMDQEIKIDTEFGGRRLLNTYGGGKGGYGGGHKGGKGGGHKGGKGGYNPPSHPYPNKPSVSVKDSNILSNIQANQASVVAVKDLDVTAKGDRNDYGNNAILTVDTRPDMDQEIKIDTEFGGRRLLNTYGGGKGGKGGGHKGGKGGYNPPSHPYPSKPSVSVKDSNILSNIQANQASVVAVKDLDVTAKGDRNDYGNNAILTVDTRPDMDQEIKIDTEFDFGAR
ncbi:MAG: hypothetical protein J3K34DRAFT_524686 [Monoraphidium minutum]|nr:MAG: hypothetical protein J3K34DRAFT_524686 [Monoraphidium minutum]